MPTTFAEERKLMREFRQIRNFPSVTCDARLCIRDIVARWRGSTHESRIFNESTLKERFEAREFKGRLIRDTDWNHTFYTCIESTQSIGGAIQ
ncbi:Uncharacterized protein OBRU01_23593 [Operophtera brumata]|uniref:Uncharacterized protein n=1 Tax=Operophtera brumata TaxID=104452 RepID=A0A0L7KPE8_OPEBR|nr:Uncharacterized protein OBRU01_23593 [Operophtera brumata]